MKKFLLFAFAILSFHAKSQDLVPYGIDLLGRQNEFPVELQNQNIFNLIYTPPAAQNIRTAAQFEQMQGVTITWTSYTHILSQIVKGAQTEVTVYIVCTDSNAVKTYLTSQSVPLTNVKYLQYGFNTIWARDYGMNTIYLNRVDSLSFVDWRYNRPRPKDDTIPYGLARMLGVPVYSTSQTGGNYLVNTGGNFMSDGQGTAFASKLILSDNLPGAGYGGNATEAQIDSMMKNYQGINRYIKMDVLPYDGIHHIDMHMKLLDEETLLIGQYPTGVADGPQIEANIAYIQNNFMDCYGRPYKIIRIPQPSDNGSWPSGSGRYLTYTNGIILNHTVIYPHYQIASDAIADSIWHLAMPGYRLWPINCGTGSDNIISQSGAIHCITHEMGVNEPILISHAHLYDTYNYTNPYPIVAKVETRSGVSAANLYWSIDTTIGYTMVSMTAMANDSFIANIPAQPVGTKIFYYIEATSLSGKTNRRPMVAPDGVFEFRVFDVASAPNISAMLTTLFNPFPNPANENTVVGFNLMKEENCQLGIYDLSGRLISNLLDEKISAGTHQYELTTENISSGTYLLTLKAGNFTATKKLMVIK